MDKPRPVVFDDDNPEWTDADFARAGSAVELLPPQAVAAITRKRGRPALAPNDRKQAVSLRISPDVLAALRATGPGWQTRADQFLRASLGLSEQSSKRPA